MKHASDFFLRILIRVPKEKQIVTGFGAFYQCKKARAVGIAVALIGWKANRQAFACV